jgi:hypothetical protein
MANGNTSNYHNCIGNEIRGSSITLSLFGKATQWGDLKDFLGNNGWAMRSGGSYFLGRALCNGPIASGITQIAQEI